MAGCFKIYIPYFSTTVCILNPVMIDCLGAGNGCFDFMAVSQVVIFRSVVVVVGHCRQPGGSFSN